MAALACANRARDDARPSRAISTAVPLLNATGRLVTRISRSRADFYARVPGRTTAIRASTTSIDVRIIASIKFFLEESVRTTFDENVVQK